MWCYSLLFSRLIISEFEPQREKEHFLLRFNLDVHSVQILDISLMRKSVRTAFVTRGWKIITKQLFEFIFVEKCCVTFQDHDKKRDKSESVSNASSDESEIDINETRRRIHLMLDDAFSLFGTQFSKKFGKEPEGQPASHPEAHPRAHPEVHPVAHPEGYPSTPARQAVIPR